MLHFSDSDRTGDMASLRTINVVMFRTSSRIILALFLAAITTVAIAWWCGWQTLPDPASMRWGSSRKDANPSPRPLLAWSLQGFGLERLQLTVANWPEFDDDPFRPLDEIWPWWLSPDNERIN